MRIFMSISRMRWTSFQVNSTDWIRDVARGGHYVDFYILQTDIAPAKPKPRNSTTSSDAPAVTRQAEED